MRLERFIEPIRTELSDPEEPDLARRLDLFRIIEDIRKGLNKAQANGDFDAINDSRRWISEIKDQISATFSEN